MRELNMLSMAIIGDCRKEIIENLHSLGGKCSTAFLEHKTPYEKKRLKQEIKILKRCNVVSVTRVKGVDIVKLLEVPSVTLQDLKTYNNSAHQIIIGETSKKPVYEG